MNAQAGPMQNNIDWTTAIGMILCGLVGVVLTLLAGFKDVIAAWFRRMAKTVERGKRKHAEGVQRIAAVHECLAQIGQLEGVDRAVIFTGTNCGGVPDPKKPYVVRPLYRWWNGTNDGSGRSPDEVYNSELRVDAHYMKVVCDLIENGHVELVTASLPPDAMMKRYLAREAVLQSRLYLIHMDATQLTWASIASYSGPFTGEEMDRIGIWIDRIRGVMATDDDAG